MVKLTGIKRLTGIGSANRKRQIILKLPKSSGESDEISISHCDY